ncbi:hypothetical protein EGW08_023138 [Elysia chlorotica]|uniref:N-acetyltransferase domain-containing protein n=1 Tax=Elysia chlorotica TaxID=188477 RepID=A0A3S0Z247_ELYCH|nr:hypothetical protein EGW08_023138 [Elysia chlorotica]
MSSDGDSPTISYRTATLSDYDAVMSIGGIYGGRDYLWSLYRQLVMDPDKHGIVALDGETVVGFYMTSTFDGGRTVLKRSGRVREDYRGRGIFHALEAELDKHTLKHRPRAMYDVFANTEKEEHLADKFLDMGFKEVCRKDMYHMLLNSSRLFKPTDNAPNKPISVMELTKEDLKLLFSAGDISRQLFPAQRLLNTYMPYRLLESNIQYMICERGGAFVSLEDPDVADKQSNGRIELPHSRPPQQEISTNNRNEDLDLHLSNNTMHGSLDAASVKNVAMVSFFYCYPTPDGFLYYLDPYARKGLPSAHFRAHFDKNMETLQRYFPNQNGILTVTHDSNIAADEIISCLDDYGIVKQMEGQEKTQILYERDRAMYGFHVEN